MTEDSALLSRYADTRAEDAFAELVRRHLDLVYSVALRQVAGDTHLAQDVTQTVFTALARKARLLAGREVLGGWLYRSTLYAASDAVRAERRRRTREQETHAMQDIISAPEPAPDLEKLRPLLDAAIGELGETDRDAVCLRFFESHSYAEIGARLHLSENSARMRVARALDKLHGLLARRGITSTTAALALALPGQAATTAPVGLATSVVGTALVASASATVGWSILALMNTPKIALGAAAVVSVVALGTAVQLTRNARTDARIAREAQATAEARLVVLEARVADQATTAAALETEKANLLAKIAANSAQPQPVATRAEEPITRDSVEARYRRAQELDKTGNLEEALREYLWCYDTGMLQVSSYGGVRRSFLMGSIARLGERLPAAREALLQRQSAALQRFMANADDFDAVMDLTSLNKALKQEAESLKLLDALSQDEARRKALLPHVYDQLATAQRYHEAAEARPWAQVSSQFEMLANRKMPLADPTRAAAVEKAQRQMVIRQAATGVEVFAGSGDVEHAVDLAMRLLAYDNSPETLALLEHHATRAGRADLIEVLRTR